MKYQKLADNLAIFLSTGGLEWTSGSGATSIFHKSGFHPIISPQFVNEVDSRLGYEVQKVARHSDDYLKHS